MKYFLLSILVFFSISSFSQFWKYEPVDSSYRNKELTFTIGTGRNFIVSFSNFEEETMKYYVGFSKKISQKFAMRTGAIFGKSSYEMTSHKKLVENSFILVNLGIEYEILRKRIGFSIFSDLVYGHEEKRETFQDISVTYDHTISYKGVGIGLKADIQVYKNLFFSVEFGRNISLQKFRIIKKPNILIDHGSTISYSGLYRPFSTALNIKFN